MLIKDLASSQSNFLRRLLKLFAIQRRHVKTHQSSETAKKCPAVVAQKTVPPHLTRTPRHYIHLLESLSVFEVGVVFRPGGVAPQTNSAPSSHIIRGPSRNNAARNAPSAPICPMLIPEETLFPFNADSRPGFWDNSPLSPVCV